MQFLDGVTDASGTDKDEDRFDADVAISTGLLSPVLDSLVAALGGEMEWGSQPANPEPAAQGGGPDDDPPF